MGKVGLVLSGGAIKGAYEAGVLKAMAQVGLHPDVIVGISAGAINGAFAAQAIARGDFTPERVEQDLVTIWRDHVTAQNFYDSPDPRTLTGRQRPALSSVFSRLGIDPLRRRYRPRWSLDSLKAFEQLVKGDFVSLLSHGYLRQIAERSLLPPRRVVRPVTLSVVTTNLMGCTEMTDAGLTTRYSHYEEFSWQDKGPGEWESMLRRLRLIIAASSAFPGVFPPVPLGIDGEVGQFVDGGLIDCAPIGRAIALDPEIDTIFVELGTTAVGRPEVAPDTFLSTMARVFSMLAGKFVIQNFQKVSKVNRQIAALRQVLDRGEAGEIMRTPRNEQICVAAGFRDLDDFLSRREIRLVPIFPDPPLPGDVFDGFFDRRLRAEYVERGYHDGMAAFTRDTTLEVDLTELDRQLQDQLGEIFDAAGQPPLEERPRPRKRSRIPR